MGNLSIDTSSYELCGEKYFELRPLRVVDIVVGAVTNTVTFFNYLGDEYGVYSITPDEFIAASKLCFTCENDCNCSDEVCSFTYSLTADDGDSWVSNDIVAAVGSGNKVYTISGIVIDGTPYAGGGIWDDIVEGEQASDVVSDYIDAIIAYLDGLSIPEFKGGWNRAKNGMANNNLGDDLLELFFDAGTTVAMDIEINGVPTGTFAFGVNKTIGLDLLLTDTSVVNPSDAINNRTWRVTDGFVITGYGATSPISFPVWTIQNCTFLDINKGWIITEAIITDNECYINNAATAVILTADIQDCIATQTTKNGTGE